MEVVLGTGLSHRRMQAEVYGVICTGGRRYRVSAREQAHQTAAGYAGPPTDHAREQQVHAHEVQPATMSEWPLDPGGYFVVKRHGEGHFGSGAAELEPNLGRDG